MLLNVRSFVSKMPITLITNERCTVHAHKCSNKLALLITIERLKLAASTSSLVLVN
jgi:hypothetical protein